MSRTVVGVATAVVLAVAASFFLLTSDSGPIGAPDAGAADAQQPFEPRELSMDFGATSVGIALSATTESSEVSVLGSDGAIRSRSVRGESAGEIREIYRPAENERVRDLRAGESDRRAVVAALVDKEGLLTERSIMIATSDPTGWIVLPEPPSSPLSVLHGVDIDNEGAVFLLTNDVGLNLHKYVQGEGWSRSQVSPQNGFGQLALVEDTPHVCFGERDQLRVWTPRGTETVTSISGPVACAIIQNQQGRPMGVWAPVPAIGGIDAGSFFSIFERGEQGWETTSTQIRFWSPPELGTSSSGSVFLVHAEDQETRVYNLATGKVVMSSTWVLAIPHERADAAVRVSSPLDTVAVFVTLLS